MNKLIQYEEYLICLDLHFRHLINEERKDSQFHYHIFDPYFHDYEACFWTFEDLLK